MRVFWWLLLLFVVSNDVSLVHGIRNITCERINCTFNVFHEERIVELDSDRKATSVFKIDEDEENVEDNIYALKKWGYGSDWIVQLTSPKQLPKDLDSVCQRDVVMYLKALGNLTEWAIKMLDASSKIQPGILTGNLVDLGMYDECISVRPQDNKVNIQGRHCLYTLSVPRAEKQLPITMVSSICLPATCHPNDVSKIVNNFPILREIGISANVLTCSKAEPAEHVSWTTGSIVSLGTVSLIVLFLIFCTICDFAEGSHTSDFLRALGKFSLCRSARSLLSTQSSPQTLPTLHGIKFLSSLWVVLGHEYFIASLRPTINAADIPKWAKTWTSLIIFMAPFAVDTFFFISGFLLAYHFLKQMAKGQKFNLFSFYLHRYIRLTPVVAVMFALSTFVPPHFDSGPAWQLIMDNLVLPCREKWLPIFFYVQNFVKVDNMCMGHTWYLAADMQLFWISPIILLPLFRKPKRGLAILITMFVASIVFSAIVFAMNRYVAVMYRENFDIFPQFKAFYMVTYFRIAPWLMGIWMGYEVATNKRQLCKTQVWLGWFLTAIAFAFCLLGYRKMQARNYEYSVVWETFYATVSRPVWAAGIAWIIYASIKGHGGLLSKFLTLSIFLPLSRLTYCIYLVHVMVQGAVTASVRTSAYFTDLNMFNSYLSNVMMSIVLAFVTSLLFESPVIVLEKMCTRNHKVDESRLQKNLHEEEKETEHNKMQ